MATALIESVGVVLPDAEEISVAQAAQRELAHHKSKNKPIKFSFGDASDGSLELSPMMLGLITRMLEALAKGQMVAVLPMDAELSTNQTAELLGVSRPFVIKEADAGHLPCRKVGAHRRITVKAAIEYKEKMARHGRAVVEEMLAASQDLGIGFEVD